MAVFRRLNAHVFLEDLAEIARILVSTGSGNRINLLIALTQHLPRTAQTAVREIGTERSTAARKEFVQIADAEPEFVRNLAHGNRLRHVLLHVSNGVQEIAANRLLLRQAEMNTVSALCTTVIVQAKAPLLDMIRCKTHSGSKFVIIERL